MHDSVFEAHPLDFWVVSMRLSNHFSSSHESWPWILLTQWAKIHFEDAFSFSHICVFMINFFNFDCGRPKTTRHFYPQSYTLISLINVKSLLPILENSTLQKKIPPPHLLISLQNFPIFLQNLMMIFLTVILSYKTLF